MRIAIGSLSIGEKFKSDTKYSSVIKKKYCSKYNYDYIEDESVVDYTRGLEWGKVKLILKYLDEYDYFIWMDSDTFIMNDNIQIEYFINKFMGGVDGDKELMYSKEYNWVNTGVLFVKNTKFMKDFFNEAWLRTNEICFDQGAIDVLQRTNWNNCSNKIVITEATEFNSGWYNWENGQFLIHFPGCSYKRPENSLQMMMNMFCPVKMENETNESYQNRKNQLQKNNVAERSLLRHKCYIPIELGILSLDSIL